MHVYFISEQGNLYTNINNHTTYTNSISVPLTLQNNKDPYEVSYYESSHHGPAVLRDKYNVKSANYGHPDQTSHFVVSNLSLHCLHSSRKNGRFYAGVD